MKILVDGRVLSHSKITGVENHAINVIEYLKEKMNIVVASPKYKNKYYTHFWEHIILPIKALSYDILFCPSNIAPLILSKKIKLIITVHDLSFKDFPQMYSPLFRHYYEYVVPRALKRADQVLTISKFSYNRIIKEYPFVKGKINYIYHGTSNIFFKDEKIKKENYILYVGSMNDTKNFSSVINSFLELNRSEINLIMVMPTSNNFEVDAEKEKLLQKAKVNPNIKIYDYLPQSKLVSFYQKAQLFIFPSYHESFGFPILEAMSCGTPVVASNTTSLPEIGQDSLIYCNPHSIIDIKEKINIVLNNKQLQSRMITKGELRAKEFTWEKNVSKHIEIFKKVLKDEV